MPELTQAAANALKQELSLTHAATGVRLSPTAPARDTGLSRLRVEVVDRAEPQEETTIAQGVRLFLTPDVAAQLEGHVLDLDSDDGSRRLVLTRDG